MAQQLPSGVSVQDVQNAISQPISVPAGQTITVDLGIPVQAGYSGDGWQVSTSGTQVTVTAPASESGGEAGDTTTTGDEETASGEEHGGLGWIIGIAAVALVGVLVLLAVLLTVGRRKN